MRIHGTIAKYIKESCRCEPCRKAWKKYYKKWRAKHPDYHKKWREKNKGYIEVIEDRKKVRKNKSQTLKGLRKRLRKRYDCSRTN